MRQGKPGRTPAVREFDVVIAGAGTGGVVAGLAAARQGARVALVEAKGYPGGIAVDALPENTPKYFEFVGGSSSKFWEITVSGDRYSVRFGRIGTRGQEQAKQCRGPSDARREALRLMRSKLAKGYQEKPRRPA